METISLKLIGRINNIMFMKVLSTVCSMYMSSMNVNFLNKIRRDKNGILGQEA